MKALVSIVVPVYNSDKWLRINIDSLLNQTYKNIEIILVNDGSSDSSGDICKEYASCFQNVRYIEQSNSGASAARNKGIQAASGKYIIFTDSDDWVSKEYVQDLVICLESSLADFAISGITCETCPPYTIAPAEDCLVRITDDNYEDSIIKHEQSTLLYSPCVGIYKLDLIRQHNILFPQNIKYGEDRIFNWRYLTVCKSIAFTKKVNYHYRQNIDTSQSKQRQNQSLSEAELLYDEHLSFYKAVNINNSKSKEIIHTKLFDSILNIILSNYNIGYRELYHSLKSIGNKPYFSRIFRYIKTSSFPKIITFLLKRKFYLILTSYILFHHLIHSLLSKKKGQKYTVLTHPLKNNYGGCIQAYALVIALQKEGIKTALYDYGKKKVKFCRYDIMNWIKKIMLAFFPVQPESKLCPDFIYQKLPQLRFCNIPITTKVSTATPWLVGSDQVWRSSYARGLQSVPFFFLDFLSYSARSRSVTYASSFGTGQWEGSPEETVMCAGLLQEFKAVSVREQSGVVICKEIFGVDAVQMPDPTLLLCQSDYAKIIDSVHTWLPDCKYLAVYMLDETEEKADLLRESARGISMPLQHLRPHPNAKKRRDRFPINVPQWLRLIRECEYFITDSFHGCVFSIIFNKPFVCLGNEDRGNERFNTLLQTFDLEDRMIINATPEKVIQVLNSPIDWLRVNAIHGAERQRGINFLKKNLT